MAALIVPARGGSIGTEKIAARYCLVEIGQLHTSHQPLRGYQPDPAYPVMAQERDYRELAERAKVEEIAEHYDPQLIFNTSPGALDGVPVATEEGLVLGGNGRTMATALVYAGHGGVESGTPRQYLIEHCHEFGLEAAVVEQFAQPMIVRTIRVANTPRTLAELSRRLNVSLSQQLNATRLAVSRARFVDEQLLGELSQLEEDETLAAFLASSRSRAFVRALQRTNVIDGRSAGLYLGAEGLLNDRGRDLVQDLLVAVLVPDAALISSYGRGPVAALARAAPTFVQVSGSPEYDVREAIAKAVRDRISMRAAGFSKPADFLRQSGMFAGDRAAVDGDARATVLFYVLDALDLAPAKLLKFARRYRELSDAGVTGQSTMFASEQRTSLEALREAAREAGVTLPAA